jgi:hypothetical protein
MRVLGVLQIIFIVLKCANLVDWSWRTTLIPTFIWIVSMVIEVAIVLIAYKDIIWSKKDK